MTRVAVFIGPTARFQGGRGVLPQAELHPPAACGDVLGAVLDGVRVIGIVDGYFDHRLSVWHKEILWAMSRGVAVYGGASMGALRAAELERFGMIGVGEIFDAYARGLLEDDDEVAVSHEAAERGYRPTSEALVNLRATLATAVSEAVLSESAAVGLIERQKRRFYPERSLHSLCADAGELLQASEAGPLCRWLRERGIVNQKLSDAEALMRRIAEDMARPQAGRRDAPPEFPHTNAWQALFERVTASRADSAEGGQGRGSDTRRSAPTRVGGSASHEGPQPAAERDIRPTLAELERRDPILHARIGRLAQERALAVALAQPIGHHVDSARVQAEADRLRRELGLLTPEQTSEWLRERELDITGFSQLVADGVLAAELEAPVRLAIERQLRHVLRLLGHYPRES